MFSDILNFSVFSEYFRVSDTAGIQWDQRLDI